MSTEFIQIYKAHGDGGERGTGPVIAFCSTESLAVAAAKGQGWWGSKGEVRRAAAISIDGKVYVLERADPVDLDSHAAAQKEKMRTEAFAKLTSAEIEALGIKAAP